MLDQLPPYLSLVFLLVALDIHQQRLDPFHQISHPHVEAIDLGHHLGDSA